MSVFPNLKNHTRKNMNFFEKLGNRVELSPTYLCIGLDPVWEKIPKHIPLSKYGLFNFLSVIISKTKDYAPVLNQT